MDEEEQNAAARAGLARIKEILDSVPDLRNGVPLPPDAQAEIALVFAEAKILGILTDDEPHR